MLRIIYIFYIFLNFIYLIEFNRNYFIYLIANEKSLEFKNLFKNIIIYEDS